MNSRSFVRTDHERQVGMATGMVCAATVPWFEESSRSMIRFSELIFGAGFSSSEPELDEMAWPVAIR
jgi:hypothetical protein